MGPQALSPQERTRPAHSHRSLVDGKSIRDPRAVAVREVQANHWPEKIVERAGFVLGEDVPESSFALRQNTFHFICP
jgi:hypothetical protein